MVDRAKTKLLEHAQLVCQAVLGADSSAHLHIHAFVSQDDSLPLSISPTHQFMVFIDFTNAPELLLKAQKGFVSFLGKVIGTQGADNSTWLYWGEGEMLPAPTTTDTCMPKTQTTTVQPSVFPPSDHITWLKTDTLLPNWLDRLLYESLGARYEPDYKRFEHNLDSDEDTLKIYLGTYFPRSYTEAFCILDSLFDTEAYAARWNTRTEARLLDIGCGTGGNLIGLLTALTKHFPHLETIYVEGFDGNALTLKIARRILTTFAQQTKTKINVTLTTQRITTPKDLPTPMHDTYDFIMSFKVGGEIISSCRGTCDSFYHDFLDAYVDRLSDIGVFILLDVTTKPEHTGFYPQLLNHQVSSYVRGHTDYGTILPTPCHIHEQVCSEHCFTQKEFRIGHRAAQNDLSRVAYRIIGRKALADAFHHDTEREAEYVISTRSGNQTFATCTYSSGRGKQMDGYKKNI